MAADDRLPRVTHRFFLPPGSLDAGTVTFPPDVSHLIARVLRLQPGDEVIVLDGTGRQATVRLDGIHPAAGSIVERAPASGEARSDVILYVGLLKAAKLELVIQKGTEIGLAGIIPMVTARAIAGEPSESRRTRFETIAREAAEQSRRGKLPFIGPPMPFDQAVREASEGSALFLWEEAHDTHLIGAPLDTTPVNLLVGPEGGFTEHEAEVARQAGIAVVTIGPRILRAETAAIVGSALLLARLGDLG